MSTFEHLVIFSQFWTYRHADCILFSTGLVIDLLDSAGSAEYAGSGVAEAELTGPLPSTLINLKPSTFNLLEQRNNPSSLQLLSSVVTPRSPVPSPSSRLPSPLPPLSAGTSPATTPTLSVPSTFTSSVTTPTVAPPLVPTVRLRKYTHTKHEIRTAC